VLVDTLYNLDSNGVGGVEIQGLGGCPSNDDFCGASTMEPHKTARVKHYSRIVNILGYSALHVHVESNVQ